MPTPGVDTYIIDQPISARQAAETDTLYLLSSQTGAPATPTEFLKGNSGVAALDTQLRAYFEAGGGRAVVQGYSGANPALADALALLPAGPGQVVAPEAVASADIITIAGAAWSANKVYLANGAASSTDSAITTLAQAVIAGATDGFRGTGMWVDTGRHSPITGNTPDNVPYTLTVAGLIAAQDRQTGNPNMVPGGVNGYGPGSFLGVVDARTGARRTTLSAAGIQVNCAAAADRGTTNYGFRTLANLTAMPHWWDFSGSRTVMALRARLAAVDEQFMFAQIDGQGQTIARYGSECKRVCAELYQAGALFGVSQGDAFQVDVGPAINPVAQLQAGVLTAQVRAKVSPFAEHIVTNISRRPLTAAL